MGWTQVANIKGADGADGQDGEPGTTTWAGITDKPTTFPPVIGSGAGDAVAGNDSRLTNARTPTSHTHSDADISNATTVGKAVLEATDQAAARTAIGAGTSNLAIGTTTGTAGDGGVLATAVQSGGALGTPSSGTLSSCGGLPVSGITASTSSALGVGSLELGHATDTTIARSAAGVITVEGTTVATFGSGTVASSATPTIDTGKCTFFFFSVTALTVDITNMSTNLAGTPAAGYRLWVAITGTAARGIAWGTSFVAGAVALPTTTVTTTRLDVGFIYDGTKWRCMASGSG